MSNKTETTKAVETVFVNKFTNGILNPQDEMLGPVRDGGTIIANTAPGCWGPMITPAIRGGHDVTIAEHFIGDPFFSQEQYETEK